MTRDEAYAKAIKCLQAIKASDYDEFDVHVSVQRWRGKWLVSTPVIRGVYDPHLTAPLNS